MMILMYTKCSKKCFGGEINGLHQVRVMSARSNGRWVARGDRVFETGSKSMGSKISKNANG